MQSSTGIDLSCAHGNITVSVLTDGEIKFILFAEERLQKECVFILCKCLYLKGKPAVKHPSDIT